jgi:hypothetical protein
MNDLNSFIEIANSLSIAGVGVLVLVFGVTEVVKRLFGLEGKQVEILAVVLGFVFTAIAYGNSSGIIPPAVMEYVNWIFIALVGSVGAMGIYKATHESE